jgi:hypothetical protein
MNWLLVKYIGYQIVIAGDQLLNAMTGGSAEETLSSRCYRLDAYESYMIAEKIIDAVFYPLDGPNHCWQAYENARSRAVSFLTQEKAIAMNAALS